MSQPSGTSRPVREIEHTWIPLADGTRLAARIWLPADAEANPVPAILEYLPYRKNEATAVNDSRRHAWFAAHGYAGLRVDMRGSGESDGILMDEYLPQEQDDALEVLAWIAAQAWCTGAVGIIGISWGGFNGLQIAARHPPELKAVISICSTDDRYADDIHYMGGCVLGSGMLPWASTMLAYNARPPDPRWVGERWREMWFERMERTPPFVEAWLSHQRRDAFWKHGSVCEDYAAVTCPVFVVGGWADGYTNPVLRLLAGLPGPRKGLIGPWAHLYPEQGLPGPAIGFLQECLRWWDHWLKGQDTGVMDEPMLRTWLQDSVPPATHYDVRPGHWVEEPAWPSPNVSGRTWWLAGRGLLADPPVEAAQLELLGVQACGLQAGLWFPYAQPGELPAEQRPDDAFSLCFDSPAIPEAMDVLGFPEARLRLASDRPQALAAVRLCDVAPDGASTLVSWGLLNLAHRDSHEQPAPLEPGRPYDVRVVLKATGHRLAAGHRWRLAISPTYWPHAWPAPEPVRLSVFTGASQLILPVRAATPDAPEPRAFAPPEAAPPIAVKMVRDRARARTIEHDVAAGAWRLTDTEDHGCIRFIDAGLDYDRVHVDSYSICDGQPLSANVQCERTIGLQRGEWQTRVETASRMWADAAAFHVSNELKAFEGDRLVFSKTWRFSVARDMP
jgi:uncharacterized protein